MLGYEKSRGPARGYGPVLYTIDDLSFIGHVRWKVTTESYIADW